MIYFKFKGCFIYKISDHGFVLGGDVFFRKTQHQTIEKQEKKGIFFIVTERFFSLHVVRLSIKNISRSFSRLKAMPCVCILKFQQNKLKWTNGEGGKALCFLCMKLLENVRNVLAYFTINVCIDLLGLQDFFLCVS